MCVCVHTRGRNFYPIDTKFGIQIGLAKREVEFEDVGPIETTRVHHQKIIFSNFRTTSLIFDLKVFLAVIY